MQILNNDDGVSWAGKTHPEIKEIAERDGSIVVVPVGSVEQHGYHLPVMTDSALADAVAHEGARRVQDEVPIIVTPPVWSGHSPGHLGIGGTISLQFNNLLAVVEDIADTTLSNGFDAILFLNGHGDNSPLLNGAVYSIGVHHHPRSEILSLDYYVLVKDEIDDIRESETGGMSHAGEFETSLMLHLYPSLVKNEEMESEYRETPYDYGWKDMYDRGGLSRYRESADKDEYSDSGAEGAPDLGTAEKGELLFDLLGREMEKMLFQIHRVNRTNG
jgi:creatinine amidohydrolase